MSFFMRMYFSNKKIVAKPVKAEKYVDEKMKF